MRDMTVHCLYKSMACSWSSHHHPLQHSVVLSVLILWAKTLLVAVQWT